MAFNYYILALVKHYQSILHSAHSNDCVHPKQEWRWLFSPKPSTWYDWKSPAVVFILGRSWRPVLNFSPLRFFFRWRLLPLNCFCSTPATKATLSDSTIHSLVVGRTRQTLLPVLKRCPVYRLLLSTRGICYTLLLFVVMARGPSLSSRRRREILEPRIDFFGFVVCCPISNHVTLPLRIVSLCC